VSPDGCHGAILNVVVEEPRFAKEAGVLGLDNLVAIDGQFHIVADAAAEGAGGVGDDFEFASRRYSGKIQDRCCLAVIRANFAGSQ
jgi:hypothetical protein